MKEIETLVPRALWSSISTWEFLETLEKCQKLQLFRIVMGLRWSSAIKSTVPREIKHRVTQRVTLS